MRMNKTLQGIIQQATNAGSYLCDAYEFAEAYSLQRILGGFSGDIITCVNSNDAEDGFTIEQVQAMIALDAFSVDSGADGSLLIKTFNGQSGNGESLTQTNKALMPLICTGGSVITRNSQPALYSNSKQLNGFGVAIQDDYSLFAVMQHASTISSNWELIAKDGNNKYLSGDQYGSKRSGARHNVSFNIVVDGVFDSSDTNETLISSIRPTTSTLDMNRDGAFIGSGSSTAQQTQTSHIVGGATSLYNGYYKELLLLPRDADTDLDEIETNILTRYPSI